MVVEMKEAIESCVKWRGFLLVLFFVITAGAGIGNFVYEVHASRPHKDAATVKQVDELKADIKAVINLFNANTVWYREIDKDNTSIHTEMEHIKEELKEIKEILRERYK